MENGIKIKGKVQDSAKSGKQIQIRTYMHISKSENIQYIKD